MAIPSYKQININNSSVESVKDQLDLHVFGQLPFILTISHLSNEAEALSSIEDYLEQKSITNYPYPIYIVSTIKNHNGLFSIFETQHECPQFFNQKIKQLNSRENKIIQKVYLKQKNLQNMQGHNFEETLHKYAQNHKEIHILEKEKDFLRSLTEKLEDYYGK